MADLKAIDWVQLLALIEQILALLKKPTPAPVMLKRACEPDFCVEDCCCKLLCDQAEIFKDAVAYHNECAACADCPCETKERAERLLYNSACAAHCAVAIHQHCCHQDGVT